MSDMSHINRSNAVTFCPINDLPKVYVSRAYYCASARIANHDHFRIKVEDILELKAQTGLKMLKFTIT